MNRRNFLKLAAAGSAATLLPSMLSAAAAGAGEGGSVGDDVNAPDELANELARHRIKSIRFAPVQLRYPRLVGKNSRLGVHGTGPRMMFCVLVTDTGAEGLGLLRGRRELAQQVFDGSIKGKAVSDLFLPAKGTLNEQQHGCFDFCLHDLAGVILNKPVYELISASDSASASKTPILTKCYSGMIYFDEMEPENKPAGLGKVLENCQYDYDYGYRQLKIKIGRGGKWMSKSDGLKTDIEVTRMIHEHFPDCELLVDGNDAFTVDYLISYLRGIEDVPLYWIEEPFRETRPDYQALKQWLATNSRRDTLLADGEADPDYDLVFALGKEQLLDVHLADIQSYGFTNWRQLMPRLKAIGMMASPHAWGSAVKSFYVAHLAAACGNVPTIEGVTCFSDDIDLSAYTLKRGQLHPSAAPGFGMKLLR